MASKNAKKNPKTRNQPEIKILLDLIFVFVDVFKVKQHIILTLLIIRNYLTQKYYILVVKIISINNSLSLRWNPTIPSLSFTQNELEKKLKK
jgi:hypothetical protein